MTEREFRPLSMEELVVLYGLHMKRDFPKSELKPLPRLLELMKKKLYEPYGLFEGGKLAAYALYWKAKGESYVMLDYFAVLPERRGQGVGSVLLREMLERFCTAERGVFGEVEIPDTGDEAVDDLRRRRLAFYDRAGMLRRGFTTKICEVPFQIISHGPEISDEALMEIDRKIYRTVFQGEEYKKNIFIPWP